MEFSYIVLLTFAILASLNMGGSNFAASFAAAYGGKVLSKRQSQILFFLFVLMGAFFLGRPVTLTIGQKIIPQELFTTSAAIVVLISITVSLFTANIMGVPQSTSLVTVGAIVGMGLYYNKLYSRIFFLMVPFWILLPITAYVLTYMLGKIIYPPRKSNFWIYEKIVNHTHRLKFFVIAVSCYAAFSVGANNVANIAGPLYGKSFLGIRFTPLLIAPIFGLGSLIFVAPLTTTGEKFVPIGILSAAIIYLICGTLMIGASIFGLPQSFVMLKVASIFAIGGLKDGPRYTFSKKLVKKTCWTWAVTPVIAGLISYLLAIYIIK